ncbi:hypothetical protein WA026_019288 [Henosepilachna vigintioctopunctata]|uniref:IMP dehydrogenase/GMP reductase domain-containing protein n=1 Tax=Henosepilachna vigintioctopunctata TaxID=420089 RepID=A0AAW1U962_9CUCU
MGSIEAMDRKDASGSAMNRYFHSDVDKMKVAWVSGSIADKGSILRFVPYLKCGIRHSCPDIVTKSLQSLRRLINHVNPAANHVMGDVVPDVGKRDKDAIYGHPLFPSSR